MSGHPIDFFGFLVAPEHGATVITLPTRLVADDREALATLVDDLLAKGARDFVIDAGACEFVDSAGLGAIIRISGQVRAAEGTLTLRRLNDQVRTAFRLTRVDKLVTITDPPSHGERRGFL